MLHSWLWGFAFGGVLGFLRQGNLDYFESFDSLLTAIPIFYVKGVAAIGVLGIYICTKKLEKTRDFCTFCLATSFSFHHFDIDLHQNIFASTPSVMQSIRDHGIRYLAGKDRLLAGWINSLVWGDVLSISKELRDAFKVSGLYHILSVSGSHVTTLVILLRFICLIPLQMLYAGYLIPGHIWFSLRSVVPLAAVPVLIAYLQVIGSPQAAVRATFLAIVHLGLQWRFAEISLLRRAQLTLWLQTCLTPEGIFSSGNLMSWVGYLCIMELSSSKGCSQSFLAWEFFKRILTMQCELIAWAVVCFGQLSLIGIPANFILAPIFAPVFWGAISLAIFPKFAMLTPIPFVQRWFIAGVKMSAALTIPWPWLYLKGDEVPNGIRAACILGCAVSLLRRLRRLSYQ